MTQRTVASPAAQPINQGQWWVLQADNGNLWAAVSEFGYHTIRFYYSTDRGVTWQEDTGAEQTMYFATNPAIYAIGGKIWMVVSTTEAGSSDMSFRWGTFNAGRTAITWTSDVGGLWGPTSDYIYNGGLVVHSQGSGYKAHFISTSRYYDECVYWRIDLNSSGAYTGLDINDYWASGGIEGTSYSNILLDPVTKDIFLVFMEGGGGPSLKFQKRSYSSATWPAGTVRTLYTCGFYSGSISSAFDGDRVVISFGDGTVNSSTPIVLERDKADTTTTTRTPPSGISGSVDTYSNSRIALHTNASKDILLTWTDYSGDPTDVYKNTFTRSGATWSGATLVRDTTPNTAILSTIFIPGTKYYFFYGDDGASGWAAYMLDDMVEVAYTGAAVLQSVATMTANATFTLAGGSTIPRPVVEIAFETDPTNELPSWTDVSEYVVSFSTRRGRQQELDTIEPGQATLELDNDDRRFDPNNTAGPYYPNVLPVRRIRIRAIWNNVLYDVFNGYVNGWPQEYPSKHRNVVSLNAIDGLGFLSFVDLNLTRVEETSGNRIGGILNDADWPSTDRDIDTGEETLAAVTESSGTALSLAQQVSATELGRLFTSKNGKITFHGRNRSLQDLPASSGTWSDDDSGPDNSYDDIVPSMDEEKIWNRVNVTREGGTLQTAQDAVSQATYFVRDLSQTGLPLTSDSVALARAQYLLSQYKDPALRFTSMEVDPRTDNTFPAVLSLELGDHILAERFSTSAISQDVMVDGINVDASRDDKSWNMTFYLTPVPDTGGFWVVGEGLLGSSTELGF